MTSLKSLKRALSVAVVSTLAAACVQIRASTVTPSSSEIGNIVFSDAWDHVHAQGRIIVGVNANRPPFAYYNQNLVIDGFDVAIMREIGQQVGAQVDFRDFTQEGLEQGVQSGQLDAAIVSATEVQTSVLRLSNTYYYGSDGVLALPKTALSIKSPADLEKLRVGVLRNGSYQAVVSQAVPSDNVILIASNQAAISELEAQRIDVAILDLTSALILASQGRSRVIGQDLFLQNLVVAMGTGGRVLAERVNAALASLQKSGRITQLALQYLRIDKDALLPLPTPVSQFNVVTQSTPVVPSSECRTGMALVQNVSFDDQYMTDIPTVQPGQVFTKTWRIRNSGTCSWYLSYRLVYEYGNVPEARMNGHIVNIIHEIKPGEVNDVQLPLTAPLKRGIYRGVWQMIDGRSRPFGERIYVLIRVPAS